jgi:putative transposase
MRVACVGDTFNVIDEFNREALRIEVDTSLPAARVIRALNELVEVQGAPLSIRLNNGPEFIATALAQWDQSKGIALNHHRPHESRGRVPPVEYRVKQFLNLYF